MWRKFGRFSEIWNVSIESVLAVFGQINERFLEQVIPEKLGGYEPDEGGGISSLFIYVYRSRPGFFAAVEAAARPLFTTDQARCIEKCLHMHRSCTVESHTCTAAPK